MFKIESSHIKCFIIFAMLCYIKCDRSVKNQDSNDENQELMEKLLNCNFSAESTLKEIEDLVKGIRAMPSMSREMKSYNDSRYVHIAQKAVFDDLNLDIFQSLKNVEFSTNNKYLIVELDNATENKQLICNKEDNDMDYSAICASLKNNHLDGTGLSYRILRCFLNYKNFLNGFNYLLQKLQSEAQTSNGEAQKSNDKSNKKHFEEIFQQCNFNVESILSKLDECVSNILQNQTYDSNTLYQKYFDSLQKNFKNREESNLKFENCGLHATSIKAQLLPCFMNINEYVSALEFAAKEIERQYKAITGITVTPPQ